MIMIGEGRETGAEPQRFRLSRGRASRVSDHHAETLRTNAATAWQPSPAMSNVGFYETRK